MAKRYHQSVKGRMAESRGMERELHRDTVHEGKRKLGSNMIKDDMSAPALLPQHVIEKYWPVAHSYHTGMIDADLFDGAQKQLAKDGADMKKAFKPGKY